MTVFREDIAGLVPTLRAFARALTSGDHALADDLVQDTMVNALQAQGRYRAGTNLEAWLFTILRNRFFSLRSRRHVSAEIGTDDLASLAAVAPAQDAILESMAFRTAFCRLPRAQREMLVLIGVRGLSYDDAAELCRCEVGTAKSRVHRARQALRAMLLDDGPASATPLPPAPRVPVGSGAHAAPGRSLAARAPAGP
jgi:RNA polymerase sigma-70 factor (ECF subfamily)